MSNPHALGAATNVNSGGTFDLSGKSETINNITLIGAGVGGNGALINSDVTHRP